MQSRSEMPVTHLRDGTLILCWWECEIVSPYPVTEESPIGKHDSTS